MRWWTEGTEAGYHGTWSQHSLRREQAILVMVSRISTGEAVGLVQVDDRGQPMPGGPYLARLQSEHPW